MMNDMRPSQIAQMGGSMSSHPSGLVGEEAINLAFHARELSVELRVRLGERESIVPVDGAARWVEIPENRRMQPWIFRSTDARCIEVRRHRR
jgi:hypothetical protein